MLMLFSVKYVDEDPESELIPDAGAIEEEEDVYVAASPDTENEDDSSKPPNLHPQDPSNFSKLAAALKLLLAWEIDDAEIDEADKLLREYSLELIYVRLFSSLSKSRSQNVCHFLALRT